MRATPIKQLMQTMSLTTSVNQDQYLEFEKQAHAAKITKSALLRKLVEDYLAEQTRA